MLRAGFFALTSLLLVLCAAGCDRDLGECNLDGVTPDGDPLEGPAALDLAFRSTDGLPMYEGQALIQSTCGNGSFCHSPAAERGARFGVAKGYDFDVALACVDPSTDPRCANLTDCAQTPESDFCVRLERLEDNRQRCADEGGLMIAEIRKGNMPPGAAGRRVRDDSLFIQGPRAASSDGPFLGTPLPDIDSGDGRDIVRNWLACNAPVVGRTVDPPSEDLELRECDSVSGEVCIYSGPQPPIPESTWSDIYFTLVFPQCLTCHAPANDNLDGNPNNPLDGQIPGGADPIALAALDLSGTDLTDTSNWAFESWSAVFQVPASVAGECSGEGTLVVPNDAAASLLVQKLRGTQTCGDEMPPNNGVPSVIAPVVEAVEAWIELGAPND